MQVKEVLRVKGNTLFTVTPDTHLSDCVVTMADHDVGSLVVMDKGALAGIVTFREVIRVLAKRQKEHRTGPTPPVAEIVPSCPPSVPMPSRRCWNRFSARTPCW